MKPVFLFIALIAIVHINVFAQNGRSGNNSLNSDASSIEETARAIPKAVLDDFYLKFEKEILQDASLENLLMTESDIRTYVDQFRLYSTAVKSVGFDEAVMRIENAVDEARIKLEGISDVSSINLVKQRDFYGDNEKISRVAEYTVEIYDKQNEAFFMEFLFVYVNNHLKLMTIN